MFAFIFYIKSESKKQTNFGQNKLRTTATIYIKKNCTFANYFYLDVFDMKNRLVFGCILVVMVFVAAPFSSAQSLKTLRSRGPMFITSLSFHQGITRLPSNMESGQDGLTKNYKKASISLINASQFMGFQFSPYFALGLGVGFEYWTVSGGNAFVPLYADLRFNMTSGKIAPHAYVNLGYGNRWHIDSRPYKATTGNSNEYIIHGATSGFMGEIGIGVKASVGYSSAIVITASGKVQDSSLRYYEGNNPPSQSMKPLLVNEYSNGLYIFAGIKVGVVF